MKSAELDDKRPGFDDEAEADAGEDGLNDRTRPLRSSLSF